ncbi:MAG: permease [Candidatus Acidiferrales bacterium]
MAAPTSVLDLQTSSIGANAWRTRTLSIVLLIVIAGVFWGDSRYPALMKRYHAGSQIKASGALTFGTVYAVDRGMPLPIRVWRTTINWLDANRVGMTFAFLFGPAALTFLGTIRRVAPIARGFYASGLSTESVLATMFASPALNVVVLAMTFALFPAPIAFLKIATVLLLIFGFAPAVASRAGVEPLRDFSSPVEISTDQTWAQALLLTLRSFAKSFWYVFKIAFPLMILGAILGAFVIEILPQQALVANVTIGGILLVALVGAFLPVPMAFDVAIAYIAMTKGVPLPYVVTILCTLGIISVFSLSVVGKTISWKVAAAAYASVVALGTLAGVLAKVLG